MTTSKKALLAAFWLGIIVTSFGVGSLIGLILGYWGIPFSVAFGVLAGWYGCWVTEGFLR